MQNLITVVRAIENIGKAIPNINTVVLSDIYKLNELPDLDYSVFAIIQDQHRQDDDYLYLNFYLYYVDRLLNDRSNQLEIQSTGINLLSFVIDKMEDLGLILSPDTDRTYQSFNQKFADECAGVYARVELMVPVDCTTPFDLLVNPLLGDLAVYHPDTYYPADFGVDAFRVVTVSGQSYQYYTEEDKTAKIDNGYHNIVVDKSGVTIDGQNINNNIADLSGITSEHTTQIETISATTSGLTSDLQALSAQTSANTADISTLSAMTSSNTVDIIIISGNTSANTQNINILSGVSSAHTTQIEELSGLTSANTENISTLSGITSGLSADIAALSAQTSGLTSALTAQVEELSGLTSANTSDIASLSAITSGLSDDIATLSGMTGDFVKKDPINVVGTSGSPVDFNTLTAETGYYYVEVHNEYAINHPVENGWLPDGMLEVVRDPNSTRITQVFTATYGTIQAGDWPKRWYRVYCYLAEGQWGWTGWNEIANKGDIKTLSGLTSANTQNITALSAQTNANTEAIATISISGVSTAVTSQLNELSGLTSANTQNIETLSAITSGLTDDIATLSAVSGDWVEKTPIIYSGGSIDFNDYRTTGYYAFTDIDYENCLHKPSVESAYTYNYYSNFILHVIATPPPEGAEIGMVWQELCFVNHYRHSRFCRSLNGFDWMQYS